MDKELIKSAIGDNIRRLRQQRKMTLEEVGKYLKVGRSNVYKYEHGIIAVPYEKILALSTLFQVSPGFLMGWEVKTGGTGTITGKVDISDKPDGAVLDVREVALLEAFHRLNEDGKDKLFDYAYDLIEMQKYTRSKP